MFTLVERDGRARSFRMANVTAYNLRGAIRASRAEMARLDRPLGHEMIAGTRRMNGGSGSV